MVPQQECALRALLVSTPPHLGCRLARFAAAGSTVCFPAKRRASPVPLDSTRLCRQRRVLRVPTARILARVPAAARCVCPDGTARATSRPVHCAQLARTHRRPAHHTAACALAVNTRWQRGRRPARPVRLVAVDWIVMGFRMRAFVMVCCANIFPLRRCRGAVLAGRIHRLF